MKKIALGLLPLWLYVGWFGCVLFARRGWGPASLIFPLVAWALYVIAINAGLTERLKLFFLAIIGLAFDSSALSVHAIRFEPPSRLDVLPIWMISIWLLFAPSFSLLKKVFARRYLLAGIAGAVLGPLSYKSGEKFGVFFFGSFKVVLAYALFWAIYFPAAIYWVREKK